MTFTTLRALEARLEAATGPDRELDEAIMTVCFGERVVVPHSYGQPATLGWKVAPGVWNSVAFEVTASLDAAVALVERVLPGVEPIIGTGDPTRKFWKPHAKLDPHMENDETWRWSERRAWRSKSCHRPARPLPCAGKSVNR